MYNKSVTSGLGGLKSYILLYCIYKSACSIRLYNMGYDSTENKPGAYPVKAKKWSG